jgi:subtilisin-like proprotein convertase family protein
LLLVLVASTAMARTVTVKLYDVNGELATNCTLVAYDSQGVQIGKFGPNPFGTYYVDAFTGEKLSFNIADANGAGALNNIEQMVPMAGSIEISVPLGAPANDDCANAEDLGPLPASVSGTTIGSTFDNVGFCGTSNTAAGVWYTFVGTGNTVNLSTCNTADYDTKISVFCFDCDNLTCIDGNDDGAGCAGFTSDLTICTQAGSTYRVLMHGFSAATGNFTLAVTDSGQACSGAIDCTPPEPEGACCSCLNAPANCTTQTASACAAEGSDFLGDGVACVGGGSPNAIIESFPDLAIPDANPAGATTTITVVDDFLIADLNVDVEITHTFLADLVIKVTAPNGTDFAVMWDNLCGSNDNMNVTFDDGAGPIACGQPTVGTFSPNPDALSVFNGLTSAGDWSLNVVDEVGADLGTIVRWGLTFTPGVSSCPEGPVCGNGIVEDGEDCDPPSDTCSDTCRFLGCDDDENDNDEGGGDDDEIDRIFDEPGDLIYDDGSSRGITVG